MRFTVGGKVAVGFGLVVVLGIVSMLIIYHGLDSVKTAMDRLAQVKEPSSAAAFEMEIQLHGLVADILGYPERGDPGARDKMRIHDARFAEFHRQYLQLAETPEGKELGRIIGLRYDELKAAGEHLTAKKDEQEARYTVVAENFEKMDAIIDGQLQSWVSGSANLLDLVLSRANHALIRAKTEAVLDVEADTAEVGLWLANYQRVGKAEYRDRVFKKAGDVRAGLRRLRASDLTREERSSTAALETRFNHTMSLIGQVLTGDTHIRERVREFVALVAEMDHILDNQIQLAARRELLVPTREAEQAARAAISRIQILIPAFVLSAIGIGCLLVRVITKPVRVLMKGTEAVGRGDLSCRVQPTGRDELADLADAFNRMVAELEATTVSKRQLEVSEQQLRDTVARLREEITQRSRAEVEQTRLQASLSRAETMAAMGSLVAGVAHEVRNPLFGLSSVLDAMDVHSGTRDEYQPYTSVLREQVERLTRLMQELLEYGKPPGVELVPGPVKGVIEDVVCTCGSLAESVGVRIVTHIQVGLQSVRMDRVRLGRAFENILQNAIQHSPQGGTVTVEVQEVPELDGVWIQCAIADCGPGIPAGDLPRIFEPFTSSSTSTTARSTRAGPVRTG